VDAGVALMKVSHGPDHLEARPLACECADACCRGVDDSPGITYCCTETRLGSRLAGGLDPQMPAIAALKTPSQPRLREPLPAGV
jgi:hypothetical protein